MCFPDYSNRLGFDLLEVWSVGVDKYTKLSTVNITIKEFLTVS